MNFMCFTRKFRIRLPASFLSQEKHSFSAVLIIICRRPKTNTFSSFALNPYWVAFLVTTSLHMCLILYYVMHALMCSWRTFLGNFKNNLRVNGYFSAPPKNARTYGPQWRRAYKVQKQTQNEHINLFMQLIPNQKVSKFSHYNFHLNFSAFSFVFEIRIIAEESEISSVWLICAFNYVLKNI